MEAKKSPLLSVIIPVYNTEKFIDRCIPSILNQTYSNLEILIINDASTDHSMEKVHAYLEKDSRIRVIEHKKNMGLFHARITGVEQAKGDYVAFVDSDDYLLVDFYRTLVQTAAFHRSDIVMGNTINQDENGWCFRYNAVGRMTEIYRSLEGKEILCKLLENEGMIFSWHTIWNKIYSKKLWDLALADLKKNKKHLIMTEDIVFSTVLFYYAKRMDFVNQDGYVYVRHSDASTGKIKSSDSLNKNIADLDTSFSFLERFLKSHRVDGSLQEHFFAMKKRYFRWWSNTISEFLSHCGNQDGEQIKTVFLKTFQEEELIPANKQDSFFCSLRTTWCGRYEALKQKICSSKAKLISFDIFDTLLCRPFWEPGDLFAFMERDVRELTDLFSNFPFRDARCFAEKKCREEMRLINPLAEDVTLLQIYKTMGEQFRLPSALCQTLMELEIKKEQEFCYARRSGKDLFDLARFLQKEIILISDMYLPKACVEELLHRNGYCGYKKLYLSSEEKRLKGSGNLYKLAIADFNGKPGEILHIGDHPQLDVEIPKKLGMQSEQLGKAIDFMADKLPQFSSHALISIYKDPSGTLIDYEKALQQLPIRCMMAIAANKLFDNPFISFFEGSDYDADAYLMGYYVLGLHCFGLVKWILEKAEKHAYGVVHFTARDGYILQKVYDRLSKSFNNAPKSNYLHLSRKSLLPYSIFSPMDLYGLSEQINIYGHTPQDFLSYFKPILSEVSESSLHKLRDEGIVLDQKFTSYHAYYYFIQYDPKHVAAERKKIAEYFSGLLGENDAVFDLGYSGKLHSALVGLCRKNLDVYYLHTNGAATREEASKRRYEVRAYYDYSPSINDAVREYLMSDIGPSCIGYRKGKNGMEPEFEQCRAEYQEIYILHAMEQGVLDFVDDFRSRFEGYIERFSVRSSEISAPFEAFLGKIRPFDCSIFSCCYLEDEVYGGIHNIPLDKFWQDNLYQKRLRTPSPHGNPAGDQQNPKSNVTEPPPELQELYQDGLFLKLYRKLNQWFPKGSKKRERMKKIASVFLHE